jgi:predicted nucleic acid-binding protein
MKFLDANVFIYAYYKPKRKLTEKQKEMKERSKEIIRKINGGEEEVITTVVHLSEVSNILKRALSMADLHSLLIGLYSLDNVRIVDTTKEVYLCAIELMSELKIDPNDCLAAEVMRREDISEIYSFDKGFDDVNGIIRVT